MLGLRHKLLFAFSGLFAILFLVAWLGMVVIERVSSSFDRIFRENLTSINACRAMREDAEEMNQFLLVALWEGSTLDTSTFRFHERDFEKHLRFQQGNITLEGEQLFTDSLSRAWGEFRNHSIDLISSSASLTKKRQDYESRVRPPFKAIQRHSKAIAELNSRNILSADGQVRAQAGDAKERMTLLLSTGGVLVILFLLILGRFILKPIRVLTRSVQEIEKGNLDLTLEVRARDELGQLAEAFNAMTARLREFRRSDHARLVRTQKTTQAAINSLPDAVAVLGPDGEVEMSNETAIELFGIKPGTRAHSLGHAWLGPLLEKVFREERPF
ncbi:MAG TPA: HAMP domain-containing protein, partial [Fibrobacteria bacterium]|nr:HAMP domain-containing protein [Fibrobacteria bacterium]